MLTKQEADAKIQKVLEAIESLALIESELCNVDRHCMLAVFDAKEALTLRAQSMTMAAEAFASL